MSQYPNSGILSRLDEKFRTSEKSPEYRGKIELGEDLCDYVQQEYRAGREVILDLSAWIKESKDGKKFFSLSVQKHYVKKDSQKPTGKIKDMEDDIPF